MPDFSVQKFLAGSPLDVTELAQSWRQRSFDPHKRRDEPGNTLCLVRPGCSTSWRARIRAAFLGPYAFLHLSSAGRRRFKDTYHSPGHKRSDPNEAIFHQRLRDRGGLFFFFPRRVIRIRSIDPLPRRHNSGHHADVLWPAPICNLSDLRGHISSLGTDVPHPLCQCTREYCQGRLRFFSLNRKKWIIRGDLNLAVFLPCLAAPCVLDPCPN